MALVEELRFCQKYPFSSSAGKIVKGENLSLDRVSNAVLERAKVFVEHSSRSKKYEFPVSRHEEILKNEVLAFPVAKIFLSFLKNPVLYKNFAEFFAESAFKSLEQEKTETVLDIASDLGVSFNLEEKPLLASVSVKEYLSVSFSQNFMRLVNQRVNRGRVYLNLQEFLHFLREKISAKIFSSLPVSLEGIPKSFKGNADSVLRKISFTQKKKFEEEFKGKIVLEALPPCMQDIYARLEAGEKVNHVARYNIAVFMHSIGMPKEQIVQLYKHTPNWNERVTRYQVDKLFEKKYSPANCNTMRSYQLCIEEGRLCPGIKHPRQYYRRKLEAGK